jgi:copper resistance protein B
MRTERLSHRASAALRVGLLMSGILLALAGPANAQGLGLKQLKNMMAWGTGSLILFDQLEYAPAGEGRPLSLDATGWYGGAYNRLWFRAEGEHLTSAGDGEGEAQLSYGRLVTAYFDALAGVRVDQRWGEESGTRAHLAVGLQGLAPLRFEFSPTLFLSQDGDLSARLEAEYQMLITQRLVASPEIELNAAVQEVPEWGVGSGLNDVEVGLRLRYEFSRKFAPYVGYEWTRRVGGSADFAREEGEGVSEGAFVAGLRVWR